MNYYAQIKDGVVVGITQTRVGMVGRPDMVSIDDMDTTLIGATFKDGSFTRKAAPVAKRLISRIALENRYTDAELLAIEVAAGDPATAAPARQAAARMRVAQRRINLSSMIDLDDPRLRAAVQAQETAGHLAAGRALAILDAPILQAERA